MRKNERVYLPANSPYLNISGLNRLVKQYKERIEVYSIHNNDRMPKEEHEEFLQTIEHFIELIRSKI